MVHRFGAEARRRAGPIIQRVTTNDSARTQAFITRWVAASGSERANYQLFVTELCDLLGTPKPDPASDDTRDNAYVFERRVRPVEAPHPADPRSARGTRPGAGCGRLG